MFHPPLLATAGPGLVMTARLPSLPTDRTNANARVPWAKTFRVGSLRFLFRIFFPAAVGLIGSASAQSADSVSVAAASNLVYAVDELNAAFTAANPEVTVTVATGASGNLVNQIKHGAPYDIFLSADLEHPQALIAEKFAPESSLTMFAVGQLVLWSMKPAMIASSVEETVQSTAVKKIAIANVDSAPYGRAAKQTLERLNLFATAEPKLVVGENITQTAQFVQTGSADVGFVALSLVLSPRLKDRGKWLVVSPEHYSPLEQGAVLTLRGAQNASAAKYLAFLRSDAARAVFERFGYHVPAVAHP